MRATATATGAVSDPQGAVGCWMLAVGCWLPVLLLLLHLPTKRDIIATHCLASRSCSSHFTTTPFGNISNMLLGQQRQQQHQKQQQHQRTRTTLGHWQCGMQMGAEQRLGAGSWEPEPVYSRMLLLLGGSFRKLF